MFNFFKKVDDKCVVCIKYLLIFIVCYGDKRDIIVFFKIRRYKYGEEVLFFLKVNI